MVTQVTLGNFFTSGGKTVLGGVGGSGLDTKSLIEGLTAAKRLPATQMEDRIKLNDKKVAALADFQKLVAKLKDAANFMRNPPGVDNASSNLFSFTKSTLTSNTSVDASAYLSVSTAPGAALQNYTVSDITQLARAKKQTTGSFAIATADTAVVADNPGAGQFHSGTFVLAGGHTITLPDGTTQVTPPSTITLNNNDTLTTVAAKINAASGNSGITASIIKVGTNNYTLSFSATQTGTDYDFDFNNVDVANTLDDSADNVFGMITVSTQSVAGVLQTAQNASFKLNGATIERQSNSITDVVDGVTFNLLQTTPVGLPVTTIDVAVKPDEDLVKNGIVNFADAYNQLKVFYAKQTARKDDGTPTDDAVLNDSVTMRNVMNNVTNQLTGIVANLSGFDRIADLGFSYTDLPESDDNPLVRNIINIDEGKLTAAISSNFNQVRNIFEYGFNSSDPYLRNFSRTNDDNASSFTLKINPYATQATKTLEVADADTDIVSATPNAFQFKAGTVTIGGQPITLVAGDTLNTIAQRFNDVTADTGITASVVQVEAGKFTLNFTSAITSGVDQNLRSATSDPTGVLGKMGITSTATFKATYTDDTGPVTVDLDGHYFTDSNGNRTSLSLTGKDGTKLEGMVMVYSSILGTEATVNITQGIADKIYNTADGTLTTDTGPLATETNALKDSDTKLKADIDRIDAQVEIFRQQLIDKFSALEQAISRVNTLLQSIDAQNQVRNNNN